MRFNIAMLFALAATTQIATATPMPVKWNDKDMEAGYKYGAIACGVGAMICDKTGHPIGKDVLQGGAYCCAAVAATVTASQGPNFQAAAAKLGNAAVVGYNGVIAGGKYVGQCVGGVCKVVVNKVKGHRSIDGPFLSVRTVNVPNEDRFDEDAVLVSRNAEPEPESDEDDLE